MRTLFLDHTLRRRGEVLRRRLGEHLRRHAGAYLLFLIHKGERPGRGQYVAFRWPGGGPYPAGATFVKRIAGAAGDTVSRVGREFRVNGVPVGTAKMVNRLGQALEPGPTGVLPA